MEKIRVLHIGIKNYPFDSAFESKELKGLRGGGMNKYCSMLISNISNKIESFLIVQRLSGQSEYEYLDGVHIYRVSTKGNRRTRQVVALIKSFFLSMKIIKNNHITIVHGHLIHGIFFAYLLGLRFKIKIVGTPYSFVVKGISSFLNSFSIFIEKNVYHRLDAIVFETDGNLNKANEIRGLKLSNSIVINTGIEMPSIKEKSIIKNKIYIFYVGRIVKIKAIDNLINGIGLLNIDEREKIHVDIIGEGELLPVYVELVKTKGLSNTITFHGFVLDTSYYFNNSDIFILPSHMEGLSISLLEAMSYGKACIVNNFELPFTEKELYVMKNNHPKTIAEAVRYFINNKDQILFLGENAKEKIKADFSINSFSNKYISLYHRLMKR